MFWLRRHHVLLRALFGTVVLETKTQVCRVWVLMLGHLLLGFLSNSQLLLLSMCIFFVVVFDTCLSVSVVASHEFVYLSPKIYIYFAVLCAYGHTHMHVRLYTC